jgi:uncharacterized protein (TIGR02001 family)
MRNTLLASAIAAGLALPSLAQAQAAAPASPHTFTGNVGLFSQYVFRGLSQTNEDPAVQGGFDYSHSSGLYAGTWASNISWLSDSGAYTSSSLEWDFYGGFKGSIGGSDFTYDVGFLYYYYPGDVAPGFIKADTQEIYGALGWKWLSAKYSYSIDDTFGVANSDGSWYLDLSASVPVGDTGLTILAHYGIQEFDGNTPAGVSNDSFASYNDWKLGVTYALPQGFTVGAYYTDTDMDSTQEAFYTINGKFIGDSQGVVFLQKTF